MRSAMVVVPFARPGRGVRRWNNGIACLLASRGRFGLSRLQVLDGRDHPAVVSVGGGEPELGEDTRDVLLYDAAGDHERLGDSSVRPPFGDQSEHLALPRSQ